MSNKTSINTCVLAVLLLLIANVHATAKTIYVHLLEGNDKTGDGSYTRPFKSWRIALQHVTGGDTLVAKNGDYRRAGRDGKWGGLDLALTLEDSLESRDPHPTQSGRPDTVGIYHYNAENPLTIRAETKHGVILDHIRFHLAQGIVIDGFDIFPDPYYSDSAGHKLNAKRDGIHGDSVYEPENGYNYVKTNDPPGGYTAAWYDRRLWTSYITVRNCKIHYACPPAGCTTVYDPLQDENRLYLIKFNQSHHIIIEDNELYDGKNSERKPAIDLPCSDDVVVRRNLIRNCHRGVVSKGGGRRVLIEDNVFVDNSGAAFSGGSTDPNLFVDGQYGDPCSFAHYESYDMTARNNLLVSTRPGERPIEPVSIWAAKNAIVVNNTFVGIGERGVLVVRPGNEVDSQARGCHSVRLIKTDGLLVEDNIFVLSGAVDETMLYQLTGVDVNIVHFKHSDNTFFNGGREVPSGGLADPNREPGFSTDNPGLIGGSGTDYVTWLATARLKKKSSAHGRGVQ
ncbi:MAG: right-handed parallel beta-helix repeat-containing protein [Pyrinomonadaceae bacterium]